MEFNKEADDATIVKRGSEDETCDERTGCKFREPAYAVYYNASKDEQRAITFSEDQFKTVIDMMRIKDYAGLAKFTGAELIKDLPDEETVFVRPKNKISLPGDNQHTSKGADPALPPPRRRPHRSEWTRDVRDGDSMYESANRVGMSLLRGRERS